MDELSKRTPRTDAGEEETEVEKHKISTVGVAANTET